MKVTFTLKDLSDTFFSGFGGIAGLDSMSIADRFKYLSKKSKEGALKISMKIGSSNAFRDQVELNQLLRKEVSYTYKIEPRKGYKLVTFEIA